MKSARFEVVALVMVLCGAGCNGEGSRAGADAKADSAIIQQATVLYVEATPAEIAAGRGNTPQGDFQVITDDLMFYRASAIEYLEKHHIAFMRSSGRRPLVFLVDGAPRSFDFKDVKLFDFVIAYDGRRAPRIIAPNEIESVADAAR